MDRGITSEDESGDEDETWEGSSTKQRVWNNCGAFIATIFVIVGELMNEQNLFGMVVIGGALATINVLVTSWSLEKVHDLDDRFVGDEIDSEDTAYRTDNSIRRRRTMDMTLIDIEDLSNEEDAILREYDNDVRERISFTPGSRHDRECYDGWRHMEDSEIEETRSRRSVRAKKRARRRCRIEEGDMEEGNAGRIRDAEIFDGRRRSYKGRREKSDVVMDRNERYRERDKRERRKDKKHKKKKRVRIAAGSAERIIIEEV